MDDTERHEGPVAGSALPDEILSAMTNPPPRPGQSQPPHQGYPPRPQYRGQPLRQGPPARPAQPPYQGQPPHQAPYPHPPRPPAQPHHPTAPASHGHPDYPRAVDEPTSVVGTRVGQYLLDGLLIAVPFFIIMMILVGAVVSSSPNSAAYIVFPVWLLALAGSWLVHAWWPSTHSGQTPAMGWLNLRIITDQGGLPALGALTVRWLLLIVDGQVLGLVGLLTMSSSGRHQRLGDMAAKTLVVRAR